MMKRKMVRVWAAAGAVALISFFAAGVRAQEPPSTTQKPVTPKGGVTCEDQSSDSCENVLNYALEVAGQPGFQNQPFTARTLTNVLNIARERLITGATNVAGSTVKPPAP